MNKSQARSSAIEPDSFYRQPARLVKVKYPTSDDHFPECPHISEDGKDCAWCAEEERHIREDFKAARYELEKGDLA